MNEGNTEKSELKSKIPKKIFVKVRERENE